jgi:AAA+ superfamily predicted ATPase
MEIANQSTEQLYHLIKGKVPYIWVVTPEERRFLRTFLMEIGKPQQRDVFVWSSVHGIVEATALLMGNKEPVNGFEDSANPLKALDLIEKYNVNRDERSGAVFIMQDFHTVLAHPVPRKLRDMYEALASTRKTVLFLSPCIAHGPGGQKPGLEPTIEKQITVLDFELPVREYIQEKITHILTKMGEKQKQAKTKKKVVVEYTQDEMDCFVSALQGLTDLEMSNAISTCLTTHGKMDEKHLLLEKKQVIKRSEILEYVDSHPTMDEVGGLDEIKRYCAMYRNQFSQEAKEFGVEPLRGLVLTGVPGTGKSLAAKAIATAWSLPLLRLDVGKVMTGLVGGSEEKMRSVIQQTEAVAPCVLWIDEIEKSLSGTKSSNFSDGGTLSRVFGTLLTAMEERMEGVVTIATANDIGALPPELIRRFNEVFFVDLPLESEREEIFEIHLNKRGRAAKSLKLKMKPLIEASKNYTGSEIEKAVREAIMRAFSDKKRNIQTNDLLEALKDTKPISRVMEEPIKELRKWARDRARYASSLAAESNKPGNQAVSTKSGKEMKIADAVDELSDTIKKKKPTEVPDRFDDLMEN